MQDSSRLERALELVEKDVNIAGFAGPIPNSLLARQDLEAAIVVLSDRQTPLRDRIVRQVGNGAAHLWNQRTSLTDWASGAAYANNLVSLFYTDGAIPPQLDPNFVQKTAAYKFLGVTGVITGPMLAAGRSYADIEAEIAESSLRAVIQNEEWAIFNGSSAINSLSFDGYDTQLTTNVSTLAGAALVANGTNIPAIDKLIKLTRLQGNSRLDGLYLSFGLQNVVNQIVATATRYFVNNDASASSLVAGDNVVTYASALGPIPIIGDFFCNSSSPYPANAQGSSGPQGFYTSTIYALRHDEQGSAMVDLMPLGRTELAKIADSVRFYINEYTVLAVKAEPWNAMLINVSDPIV